MVSLLGGAALACATPTPAHAQSYTFLRSFDGSGTNGSGVTNGPFSDPTDIKIDSNGNVFVADTGNNRVEEFTGAGVFLNRFGRAGTANGRFTSPQGLAIDSNNNIFVADTQADRVQKFNNSGVYQAQFSVPGNANAFSYPTGLAFDSSGSIYVGAYGLDVVRKYTVSGPSGNTFTQSAEIGGSGSGDGQLSLPSGVALDSNNNIFVANSANNRVEEYSSSGAFVRNFTITDPNLPPTDPNYKQYFRPLYLAVDKNNNIFVTDFVNNFVAQFSDTGQYLGQFGTTGVGDGEFSQAGGVTVDNAGNVYVADSGGNRVEEFAFVAAVPEAGTLLTLACMTVGGLCATRRLKKERRSQPVA